MVVFVYCEPPNTRGAGMTKDLWADMPNAKILHGDCMELLKSLPDNSIDAIVTDPPYGMSGADIVLMLLSQIRPMA